MQGRGACPTYIDYSISINLPLSVVSSNVPVAVDHAAVATTEAYTAPISTLIPATLNQIDSASTSRPEISSTVGDHVALTHRH